MARLTKRERAAHQAALNLLSRGNLSDDDVLAILSQYHEGASHYCQPAGAFFTPFDLARDFVLEIGFNPWEPIRVLDMCAGIGCLSIAVRQQFSNSSVTAIELNPEYVEVGKALAPEVRWVCGDVMDPGVLAGLGQFDVVIGNPPFGNLATTKGQKGRRYTGGRSEFKLIDAVADLAGSGVFILPQESAGFRYSGERQFHCLRDTSARELRRFEEETGIQLQHGMGIDTKAPCYSDFKDTSITVEFVDADFSGVIRTGENLELFVA